MFLGFRTQHINFWPLATGRETPGHPVGRPPPHPGSHRKNLFMFMCLFLSCPSSSVASVLSELKCAITATKKGQAAQRSQRTNCTFERCMFVIQSPEPPRKEDSKPCWLSRKLLWIFSSDLAGDSAVKNVGDFLVEFQFLRFPIDKEGNVLNKFGQTRSFFLYSGRKRIQGLVVLRLFWDAIPWRKRMSHKHVSFRRFSGCFGRRALPRSKEEWRLSWLAWRAVCLHYAWPLHLMTFGAKKRDLTSERAPPFSPMLANLADF